jgi:tetratricopeptide (TPR) repeat protein
MDDNNVDKIIDKLSRDLDIKFNDFSDSTQLSAVFAEWKKIPQDVFQNVALDLSLFAGSYGDWALAYEILLALTPDPEKVNEIKLWEIRCLYEMKKPSEALALARSVHWHADHQIHVNYLSGLAYESLGMKTEAAQRFDAVFRRNPNYSDVALRQSKD